MTDMITTYLVAVLLVSLGFFGVGALASATELREPPALALEQLREAGRASEQPR